jgi:putative flippase GtrA
MSTNTEAVLEPAEPAVPEEKQAGEVKILSDEEVSAQIKPLSKNGFVRGFQKAWRGYITAWHSFADKHPKASKAIYMLGFFFAFSMGVTVWQFIVMTFMPAWFGGLNDVAFVWPKVELPGITAPDGTQQFYAIFNEPARQAGKAFGGLGNFIAFEIAVFTAQCINFPLQRNITFRSHGNPWLQAMWYFIGWVLISVFVNALWGIMNPFLIAWNWPEVVNGLIKTFVTGGISMIIFFPIFLIIFPDYNKVAKNLKKKVEKMKEKMEKMKAAGVSEEDEKLVKLTAKLEEAELKAKVSNTEKTARKTATQASTGAMTYFKAKSDIEKMTAQIAGMEADFANTKTGENAVNPKQKKIDKLNARLNALTESVPKRLTKVSEAVAKKSEANSLFLAAKAEKEEYDAAKAAAAA